MILPIELINIILSFREKHPTADMIRNNKKKLRSLSCHIDCKNCFIWFNGKLQKLDQSGTEYFWSDFDN